MKKLLLILSLGLLAQPAAADCFVEYKAKQDDPLKLHYGITMLDLEDCSDVQAITTGLEQRLTPNGWTLLNIVGTSVQEPTDEQKVTAGEYYLRY